MSEGFEIQYEWLPRAADASLDGLTSAALSIMLNGVCVTEVEDRLANVTRPAARLSAWRMAQWLAGNWWRLRWEPEPIRPTLDWKMSHNLASASGGYLWPSLTFGSDGETILIRSQASPPSCREPVRYLRDNRALVAADDFERVIDNFVAAVIAKLPDQVEETDDLVDLWAEIAAERKDPDLYALRQLEARLGHDPDEAPATLIDGLLAARRAYGADAVLEMAAASHDQALDHLGTLVQGIGRSSAVARVSDYDIIRDRYTRQAGPSAAPWQRGVAAAQVARKTWNLPSGPARTDTLADLFGVNIENRPVENLPISAGLRDSAPDGIRISLNQRPLTGRRFALARLVADHIATPQDEILLPLTRARTSRQRLQRAFAQEFLCPFTELQDFLGAGLPGDDDIDDAAEHFEVSPLTIRTTLVNRGVMERETLDEWAL